MKEGRQAGVCLQLSYLRGGSRVRSLRQELDKQ